MAISRELKEFIQAQFQIKIGEVRHQEAHLNEPNAPHRIQRRAKIAEICVPLQKQYEITAAELKAQGFNITYSADSHIKNLPSHVGDNNTVPELMAFREQVKALELARDRIIVKLSIEKDLEKITKLLADFGITL